MKLINLILITGLLSFNSCKDKYTGPGPTEPTCFELPMKDTVEYMKGTVRLVDTTYYISNYINETTVQKYYPCALNALYIKEGFPLEYSGRVRKKEGDNKDYIELTQSQPILNETIITNYKGLVRFRDSTSININEKTITIKNSKIENYKLKLQLEYSGCTQGRLSYISLYKTKQSQGVTTVYGYLTSPYESCLLSFLLWYEIDVSSYKDHRFLIFDGVKMHVFDIPK